MAAASCPVSCGIPGGTLRSEGRTARGDQRGKTCEGQTARGDLRGRQANSEGDKRGACRHTARCTPAAIDAFWP